MTTFHQSGDVWAKVDSDLTVSHLDMDLCAKGPQNAYTALALAAWNKALETAASEVFCDDPFYDDEIHTAILRLKK